ncbi:alkaline phosphatase family protein [Robertkochia solimangrovi]|uniref:alkaline phosphatase family protein n=1 Tax=Robertkochia solimangrovi TaxID=2213046 RepID=UPI00117EEA26|nr:alkaline phosphatase family protein [Robertkochia solimangrovi]TRZ41972.1 alkaline phosphatase family protein [Robertkochia solimangrovi]
MQLNRILLLVALLTYTLCMAQSSEELSRKTVFIIIDGISSDQLKKADTPNLDRISKKGGYTDAYVGGGKDSYSETPTISAVGYNSLLTGTWANKHNVWGNEIKAPNYNYPTIFKLYKDQYPKGTTAVYSSWLDNRTKLVGEGLPETGNYKIDYTFDGLEYDTINYPHDPYRNFMKLIDYSVADHAAESIRKNGPDLSWVYLEFSDDMGHGFGDSERFSAAIHFEDQLIGKIYNAILEREQSLNEEWLLIITTDHGRSSNNGKHHGGQSERERSTWIITNIKNTNEYFSTSVPGIVDILPTMTDFMHINVPQHIRREMDGISLIHPADMMNLSAEKKGKNLIITWDKLQNGQAKLYASGTNEFNTGGKDTYEQLKTLDLSKEETSIPLRKLPKGYTKLVLESENTTLNTWIPVE